MEQTKRNDNIQRLCREVERSLGTHISSPSGFSYLRECLFERTRLLLSVSTLMRVWGYMSGGTPRESTLTGLARFIGYDSFDTFCRASDTEGSGYVGRSHFRVRDTLRPGDILHLIWQPGRRCMARYTGDERFVVEEAENTRLTPGCSFRCSLVIEGEPLYLDSLERGDAPVSAYVCGKISGIHFQIETSLDKKI